MSNYLDMLDYLMHNDVDLHHLESHRIMSADCLNEMNGEFVVYADDSAALNELYRGTDFDMANQYLTGELP